MAGTISLSFRVDSAKAAELEKLAAATDRPKSWLLERALDAYLEDQAWQVARTQEAIAQMDRGEYFEHQVIKDWLLSWGTDTELDPPKLK